MSTTTAVESVKPENLLVARSYGATPAQTVWRVYIPSMLPVLLEALRISMIFNLTGVMLAEMYASRAGVGHLICPLNSSRHLYEFQAPYAGGRKTVKRK